MIVQSCQTDAKIQCTLLNCHVKQHAPQLPQDHAFIIHYRITLPYILEPVGSCDLISINLNANTVLYYIQMSKDQTFSTWTNCVTCHYPGGATVELPGSTCHTQWHNWWQRK